MATTCDPLGRIIEFDQFIGADGLVYDLHAPPVRTVCSVADLGLPPLEYTTERAPQQHGVTIKDHFLKPRVVQMIVRQQGVSRLDRWFSVGDIMSALKPNRTVGWTPGVSNTPPTAGVLRRFMPNGSHIDLSVFISQGPKLEPRNTDVWDEWAFQETLRFIAHDPLFFNPVQKSVDFTSPTTGVVFPTLFPILFGQLNSTANVAYLGNWQEYPAMTVTGPLTNLQVYNHTNGGRIKLTYDLAAGHTITIALPYGNKSITLDDGTDLLQYLTDDSDLVTFHLDPDPLAPSGINQVQVIGGGVSGTSDVRLTWYDRYVAIQQV